jgi:hypothetical protein
VSLFRPQPVRTRAATAVTPSTLVKVRMCSLSSHRVRAERGFFSVAGGRPDRVWWCCVGVGLVLGTSRSSVSWPDRVVDPSAGLADGV